MVNPTVHVPLTPAMFHVLLALADASRHGYGIMKEIERHTGGAFTMGPGTLYGTLQRLLDQKWVVEAPGKAAETARDERRRFYRLTTPGRRALTAEVDRLEAAVRVARAIQATPKPAKG